MIIIYLLLKFLQPREATEEEIRHLASKNLLNITISDFNRYV